MGNFYVNHTLRTADRERIGDAFMGRKAFISPVISGMAIVYDMMSDMQYEPVITDLGMQLSDGFKVPVLAVLNHDDDILAYWLFERGKEIDSYNSAPDYFENVANPRGPIGGKAEALCAMFGAGDASVIEPILRTNDDRYLFAVHRHAALLQALGFAQDAFFYGYRYLESGEVPEGLSKGDFIEVGGEL